MKDLERIKSINKKLDKGSIGRKDIEELINSQTLHLKKFSYSVLDKLEDCGYIDLVLTGLTDKDCLTEAMKLLAKLVKICQYDESSHLLILRVIRKEISSPDCNPVLKIAMLEYLSNTDDQNVIDLVRFFTKDSNELVRIKSIDVAGGFEDLPSLLEALNDHEKVKITSLKYLVESKDAEIVEVVRKSFLRGSSYLQSRVIEFLIEKPSESHFPILKESITQDHLKEAAVEALGNLSPNEDALDILIAECETLIMQLETRIPSFGSVQYVVNLISALARFDDNRVSELFERLIDKPISPCFNSIITYFNDHHSLLQTNTLVHLIRLGMDNQNWIEAIMSILSRNPDSNIIENMRELLYHYGPTHDPKSYTIQLGIIRTISRFPRQDIRNIFSSIDNELLYQRSRKELERILKQTRQSNLSSFF